MAKASEKGALLGGRKSEGPKKKMKNVGPPGPRLYFQVDRWSAGPSGSRWTSQAFGECLTAREPPAA